jgi:hypothetical protein
LVIYLSFFFSLAPRNFYNYSLDILFPLFHALRMARGPQVRRLEKDQIDRLEKFRRTPYPGKPAGYSYPQLAAALGNPCTWKTVKRALEGRPIANLIHHKITEWIERYLPTLPPTEDGKVAATATDRPDEADTPELQTKSKKTTIPFPGRDLKGEN